MCTFKGTKLGPNEPRKAASDWKYTSTPQYVFIEWSLIKHSIPLHGVMLS
jgi:hypothetical protein